jgi:hypothetical protein
MISPARAAGRLGRGRGAAGCVLRISLSIAYLRGGRITELASPNASG